MNKSSNILSKIGILVVILALILQGCAAKEPPRTQKHDYVETPIVDYSITGLPEFVSDVSECTDTSKQYVLPDGYLYEYKTVIIPTATNQIENSIDVDGSDFNGCGYQNNARIRNILEIGESNYCFVTGFIPIKCGDVICFDSNCFNPNDERAGAMVTAFYDSEMNAVAQVAMHLATSTYFEAIETNDKGYVYSMKVVDDATLMNIAYVRFTLIGSGDGQLMSINEPLDVGYESYTLTKKEKYVPESWYEEILTSVDSINSIELTDESTAVKFMFASDIHLDPGSTSSYTENIGKVSAEVMRACDIPFFVTGGDNCTQSSGFMPSDFYGNMTDVLVQMEPIPQKNILLSVGNHDGATGQREINGEIVYYRYQLNNEERSEVFFGWQRETNENKRFSNDGTYYYMDDPATKTRYIILNSFWSQWEGEADGFVTDPEHSIGHAPIFGPSQLKWFAEVALDMPPEYGALLVVHFAPDARDFEVFKGIVEAFNDRSIYTGSYASVYDWQSTDITVNYKEAYGEIIAVFQGHRHTDAEWEYFKNVPCINITTTGAYWAVKDENAEDRIRGTSSEFALDAVVIDRSSRKIYIARVGAGEDRIIEY